MNKNITCVILAGGLARRLGNVDKAAVELNGQSLLERVLKRLVPQVSSIIINANGNPDRFSQWEKPVVADTIAGFPGPLAGVLAAMEWASENQPHCNWIVSVPVDTPFLPHDLVARFASTIKENAADLTCAKSANQAHPVVGFWPVHLARNLREAMTVESLRKVDLWTARFNLVHTVFETDPIDPFFNINRHEDVERAEKILQKAL